MLAVINSKFGLNQSRFHIFKKYLQRFHQCERSGQCAKDDYLSAKKEAFHHFMGFPDRWKGFILVADPSKRLESGKQISPLYSASWFMGAWLEIQFSI